MNCQTN